MALALILGVGVATAAIAVTYATPTNLTTSVTSAPVQYLPGTDAGPDSLGRYVTAYAISGNKTSITATVKGVPEANLTIGSFLQLQNVDTAARTVTLTTAQVTNSYVTSYKLELYDGSTLVGTLTMTDATPTATLAIPAGTTLTGKLTLGLATGAGADNVALSNAIALTVA